MRASSSPRIGSSRLPEAGDWLQGAILAATGIVAALASAAAEPASPWRHACAVPVVAAALRYGLAGGGLAAIGALLLQAPGIVAHVERLGLGAPVVEEIVTALGLLVVGPLLGARVSDARRQRRRYRLALAVQEALADEPPLPEALERLRACLAAHLDADVALVVREGEAWHVSGGAAMAPTSPAARAAATGAVVHVPDAGGSARPRRLLAAPLVLRGRTVGALAVERQGELPVGTRETVAALAVHVALALEACRLTARQRRFAEELAEKVREAAATKTAFVALASHELRTPLTALLGFSELMASRPLPPDEVRRQADIMRREARRLARLIDDFLDLARLERGVPPPLRMTAVPVAAALQEVAELFRYAGAAHPLVVECPEGVPPVRADAHALERILANLIGNATKYSPAGRPVAVRATAAGAAVVFVVEDQGPGIPPEVLPRIFDPYYRAPATASTTTGLGLGLAVVKALVEAQGGTIGVESERGRGTRVTFRLPAFLDLPGTHV